MAGLSIGATSGRALAQVASANVYRMLAAAAEKLLRAMWPERQLGKSSNNKVAAHMLLRHTVLFLAFAFAASGPAEELFLARASRNAYCRVNEVRERGPCWTSFRNAGNVSCTVVTTDSNSEDQLQAMVASGPFQDLQGVNGGRTAVVAFFLES